MSRDFLNENQFEFDIWKTFFSLAVQFLTQKGLQLEKFSPPKRAAIIDKYGDMRVLMGFQMVAMWNQLDTAKTKFIPSMVAPFLEVTLVPETELRKATIPIFYDMINAEFSALGNFKQVRECYLNWNLISNLLIFVTGRVRNDR